MNINRAQVIVLLLFLFIISPFVRMIYLAIQEAGEPTNLDMISYFFSGIASMYSWFYAIKLTLESKSYGWLIIVILFISCPPLSLLYLYRHFGKESTTEIQKITKAQIIILLLALYSIVSFAWLIFIGLEGVNDETYMRGLLFGFSGGGILGIEWLYAIKLSAEAKRTAWLAAIVFCGFIAPFYLFEHFQSNHTDTTV